MRQEVALPVVRSGVADRAKLGNRLDPLGYQQAADLGGIAGQRSDKGSALGVPVDSRAQ